jgi:hypothetical protein
LTGGAAKNFTNWMICRHGICPAESVLIHAIRVQGSDGPDRPKCGRIYLPHFCYVPGMDIEITDFSTAQQRALFDLLILAMYADGHLTTFEDGQLQKLLAAMGHTEEADRQREFDAAVTRIRPCIQSIHQAKTEALTLADAFTLRSQQKQVFSAVEQMMTSDQHVSSWENTLLMELRMKFRL